MIYRLSTSQMIQNGLVGIYQNQAAMAEAQNAIVSGVRNDMTPVEEAQALSYKLSVSTNTQNNANIDAITPRLESQEIALTSLDELTKQLTELGMKAGNGVVSDLDKAMYKGEFEALRTSIMSQLNSKDPFGEYQFSGFSSRVEPFDASLNYQGDDSVSKIRIGNMTTVELNIPGSSFVTDNLKNVFSKFDAYFSGGSFDKSVLGDISKTQDDILNQITKVGTRYNTMALLKEYNQDSIDSATARLAQLEDVDYAKAMSDFTNAQNALQASLKTQVVMQNLSMFNYI